MSKANEISEMIRRLPRDDKQRLIDLIWLLYRAPGAARDAAITELETTLQRKSLSSDQLLRKVESVIAKLHQSIQESEHDGASGHNGAV